MEWYWFHPTIPADPQIAKEVIQPMVDKLKVHKNLNTYLVKDEPDTDEETKNKVKIAVDVFKKLDATRSAIPLLGYTADRTIQNLATSNPDVMMIDIYPITLGMPLCELNDIGPDQKAMLGYIRQVVKHKPADVPFWAVLQAFDDGNETEYDSMGQWRYPKAEEIRLQNWLALGEGATGIVWFLYNTILLPDQPEKMYGNIGLKENINGVYDEISKQALRVKKLQKLLINLRKVPDVFTVSGGTTGYISTLKSRDGSKEFAIAVNRSCSKQSLRIDVPQSTGVFRDLEKGRIYQAGSTVDFEGGDGKVFMYEKNTSKTKVCLQVLTSAVNPQTGECKTFPTSCISDGWVRVKDCAGI